MGNSCKNQFIMAMAAFNELKKQSPTTLYSVNPFSAKLIFQSIDALNWAHLSNKSLTSMHQEGGLNFKRVIDIIALPDVLKLCSRIEKNVDGKMQIAQCLQDYKSSGLEEAVTQEISKLNIAPNGVSEQATPSGP